MIKCHFSFKIDKEVSIFFNVPTYSDAKKKNLVDKKKLHLNLQDIANPATSIFFIVSRIRNVKQNYKNFKFIILRQFV